MTNKHRVKGFNFERELVNQFKDSDIAAERCYGSNGQSRGLPEEVDLIVPLFTASVNEIEGLKGIKQFHFQCKRKKKLPDWLGLTENVDGAIVREDRGESFIMLRLEDFINMVK